MILSAAREGVAIALDSLRSQKLRSALTILAIMIGTSAVVLMASIVGGIRGAVTDELEAIGPENFVVERFDMSSVRLADMVGGESPWSQRPSVTLQEAELIAALPSVRSATPSVTGTADVGRGPRRLPGIDVEGVGAGWADYKRGDFSAGRDFLPGEVSRTSNVVVISAALAKAVFGEADAVGATLRLSGRPFRVVGVYREKPNVFSDAAAEWIVAPYSTTLKYLAGDKEWMEVLVVPAPGYSQAQVMDEVTAVLRTSRRLRPGAESDFALVRQDAFGEMFDRLTGGFFLVMIFLSSTALVVGGVGVTAIMMISVTERTREIGVRKALGARSRDIQWQFLVEAVTVTVVGGALGMALAGGGTLLVAALTPVPAVIPLWSVIAALLAAVVAGVGFGLYPANRAARLDPVVALRHE